MCAEKEEIAETKIDRLIRSLDRLSAALEAQQQARSWDALDPYRGIAPAVAASQLKDTL